nr:MAG TPA: hypothetical protein [Caudoviricetes sp.]
MGAGWVSWVLAYRTKFDFFTNCVLEYIPVHTTECVHRGCNPAPSEKGKARPALQHRTGKDAHGERNSDHEHF